MSPICLPLVRIARVSPLPDLFALRAEKYSEKNAWLDAESNIDFESTSSENLDLGRVASQGKNQSRFSSLIFK
jgi:hypothetical protein